MRAELKLAAISFYEVRVLLLLKDKSKQIFLKLKASDTRYRALGPELIPVYRQSARR